MHYNQDRFAGWTIIVTGAGAGIGRATADRIIREGGRVIASDTVADRLAALVADHPSEAVVSITGDISREEDVARIVAACDGRIDGLANVAGIMDGFLPAAEVDDATWERVLSVNLTAAMRLTRAVLPTMLAAGGGSIVNVASVAGLRGSAAGAAYTASKHGLIGLSRSTAFIYGPKGIRTNVVAPGGVETAIAAVPRSDFAWSRIAPVVATNAPPSVQPNLLASNVLWLLSDEAANVNGAVLSSDGGWAAT